MLKRMPGFGRTGEEPLSGDIYLVIESRTKSYKKYGVLLQASALLLRKLPDLCRFVQAMTRAAAPLFCRNYDLT